MGQRMEALDLVVHLELGWCVKQGTESPSSKPFALSGVIESLQEAAVSV